MRRKRGKSAAFPTRFSAAKVFYDLRLDLRIEHLPFLRGYGSGCCGKDNERDADMRPLRGRCAALRLQRTLGRGKSAPRIEPAFGGSSLRSSGDTRPPFCLVVVGKRTGGGRKRTRLESGRGEGSGVSGVGLLASDAVDRMRSMDCARAWATESEASALALFHEAGYGRERCQKTQSRESRSQVAAGKRTRGKRTRGKWLWSGWVVVGVAQVRAKQAIRDAAIMV